MSGTVKGITEHQGSDLNLTNQKKKTIGVCNYIIYLVCTYTFLIKRVDSPKPLLQTIFHTKLRENYLFDIFLFGKMHFKDLFMIENNN